MKYELQITLMVSEAKRGYRRLKARVAGPRSGIRPGEVEVPMTVVLDSAWFKKCTPPLHLVLPDPPPPSAEAKLP
jgi:hypothetical protein